MGEITIPGDPSGLSGLASQFGSAADAIGQVHGRVSANGLQGSWSGKAAEAFSSTVEKVPPELEKVVQAFSDAGRAIGTFSSTLSNLQKEAGWYNRQIEEAQRHVREAEEARETAESELRAARARHGSAADPATLHSAQTAVSRGEGSVNSAAARVEDSATSLGGLEKSATRLKQEYEHAVDACCGALDHIGHAGGHSFLSKLKGDVKKVGKWSEGAIGAAARFGKREAEDAEKWAERSGKDLFKFDKDLLEGKLSWADARAVLEDYKAPLEIAGIAVGIAIVLGTGGTAAPALALAITAATATDDVAIGSGDTAEAVGGNKAYRKYLAGDAGNLVLDSVGVHGATKGVAAAARDDWWTQEAKQSAEKYAQTGDPFYQDLSNRSAQQVSTMKGRALDLAKDQIKDKVDDHAEDSVVDKVNDAIFSLPKPSAQQEIALPAAGMH
jgi:uncharacterized protein YukE